MGLKLQQSVNFSHLLWMDVGVLENGFMFVFFSCVIEHRMNSLSYSFHVDTSTRFGVWFLGKASQVYEVGHCFLVGSP